MKEWLCDRWSNSNVREVFEVKVCAKSQSRHRPSGLLARSSRVRLLVIRHVTHKSLADFYCCVGLQANRPRVQRAAAAILALLPAARVLFTGAASHEAARLHRQEGEAAGAHAGGRRPRRPAAGGAAFTAVAASAGRRVRGVRSRNARVRKAVTAARDRGLGRNSEPRLPEPMSFAG